MTGFAPVPLLVPVPEMTVYCTKGLDYSSSSRASIVASYVVLPSPTSDQCRDDGALGTLVHVPEMAVGW